MTQPEPGSEPVPGYRLVQRLGSGGVGEVWKADAPGGFPVALKFSPRGRAGGADELRALELLRHIRHPNLLVTFAAWEIGGWLIIAMELADKTLLDRFREATNQGLPGIPSNELLDYFQGAAQGIDYLNELRAVPNCPERIALQHRDIKPQNILLVGNGVKVADFGLARTMKHAVTGHSGKMTPYYAAPEFFKGQTTSSSDQYSLAVTYCKTRGGKLPFDGTLAEIMTGHVSRPPDLTMLPAAERAIIQRALAKDPEKRWPSCRAMVDALRQCATAAQAEAGLATTITEAPALRPMPAVAVKEAPSHRVLQPARDVGMRSWLIGRAADCDLIVNQDAVSGHHCRLTETVSGFILEDLQSSNGTYVNGKSITTRLAVAKSDKITLGRTVPLPWPGAAHAGPVAPTKGKTIHIGRDADNDIVLDYPTVSGRHARITFANGQATIEDLNSTNGIAVGRPEAKVRHATLKASDFVYFGSLRIPAVRLLEGKLALGSDPHMVVTFTGKPTTFGRSASCDVVLDYPMISARHARLTRKGSESFLEDLGSTNGTFLNGCRICTGSVPVKPGDVIGLGSFSFKLNEQGNLEKHDDRGNLTLEARAVTVDISRKRLIENISLTIFPGEIVALLGPSGAGKTTLLNALNGYAPPTEGEVTLNHHSLYENYARFAPYIGYVPQEDIIHSQLTVFQALYYTARLRLPEDFGEADIRTRIAEVIRQLGLEGTEDVLIGSPERRGISGGQRKRVNLAMELITDPLLLFLDEPTSGLSSEDALLVMKHLRSLADAGKTVLLTIHQPSLEIFQLLDNLAVIGKDINSQLPGALAYYGPAYPDAIEFFSPSDAKPSNPDGVLRGLAGDAVSQWVARYKESPYHRKYIQERAGKKPTGARTVSDAIRPQAGGLSQWWTLVRRMVAIKMSDKWSSAILFLQAPVVAVFIVLGWGSTLRSEVTPALWGDYRIALGQAIFMTVLSALWFGCTNSVREIVGEWAIYRRERMVTLRLLSYVGSKFAVLSTLCFMQCLILAAITHYFGGLTFSLVGFGLLILVALVGAAMGLMISSLARSSDFAIAMLPVILLPMVFFGGAVRPIPKMGDAKAICQVMPPRWAFEGSLLLQSERLPRQAPLSDPTGPQYDMADFFFPEADRHGPATAALVLAGMLLAGYLAIHGFLRLRDSR
ncbi:MAG TPA: FHA domain-containing protein [Gemmataceae bacterium]|nr:FHA domain-containing protein [Gemmataceae bacterium]